MKFRLQTKPCLNCGKYYSMTSSGIASDGNYYIRCVYCNDITRLTGKEFDDIVNTIFPKMLGVNQCKICMDTNTCTFLDINDQNINHILCFSCDYITTF